MGGAEAEGMAPGCPACPLQDTWTERGPLRSKAWQVAGARWGLGPLLSEAPGAEPHPGTLILTVRCGPCGEQARTPMDPGKA